MSALLFLLAAGAAAVPAAPAAVPVSVLARAVARGDVLSAADFEAAARPAASARGALSPRDADGQEAARALPAGAVVRAADVVAPRLVRRGEPVTIVWRQGGLSITGGGRALTSGGQGDMVRVVASTNRTLDGIVDGAGSVRLP